MAPLLFQRPILRDIALTDQGGPAEPGQVDTELEMLRDAKRLRDTSSRQDLLPVHLPVPDRQREQLVSGSPP